MAISFHNVRAYPSLSWLLKACSFSATIASDNAHFLDIDLDRAPMRSLYYNTCSDRVLPSNMKKKLYRSSTISTWNVLLTWFTCWLNDLLTTCWWLCWSVSETYLSPSLGVYLHVFLAVLSIDGIRVPVQLLTSVVVVFKEMWCLMSIFENIL